MFLSAIRWHTTAVRTITMSAMKSKIAVAQMTATNDKTHNLLQVTKLVQMGKAQDVQMIFLPEACDYIAENGREAIELAEPLTGSLVAEYKKLAKTHDMWLSLGGIHELTNDNKAFNCHVVINNMGEIVSAYRKLHLFNVNIPEEKIFLMESNTIKEGPNVAPPVKTPTGMLGLSICYDMRFPELSVALRQSGADILTYPSAFTYVTGLAHWQVLLRARAVESQCFVIAAAQVGAHNPKRMSYGQAMVVDPWGKIISECEKHDGTQTTYEPSICVAEINLEKLADVRRKMPVLEHRRFDIYGNIRDHTLFAPSDLSAYKFAEKDIPVSTVFLRTNLSYAFTNLRCVVPGHVLVAPIRCAQRLVDLTPEETSDLFQTVIRVQGIVEKAHNAESSTITVQDGKNAGQSVNHVHVHVLPRLPGDFKENDEIYAKMATHDRGPNMKPARTIEAMSEEAEQLKSYVNKL